MKTLAALGLALLLAAAPATAQEYHPANSREQAALDLLETMGMESMMTQLTDVMTDQIVSQSPELARFSDIFHDFLARYMRWDALRPEYVRMYSDAFTEPELRELRQFYSTPLGHKTMRLAPQLMQQGMELGQRTVQAHVPELQALIQQRMMETGGAAPPADGSAAPARSGTP